MTGEDVNGVGQPPPFPLERPTSAAWREQALSKVAELGFVRDWMLNSDAGAALSAQSRTAIETTIDAHLRAATAAAKGGRLARPANLVAALTGSGVERVTSQLDAVEGELLRIASTDYLGGEISSLLAHVQLHLNPADPRRVRVETIAQRIVHEDAERRAAALDSMRMKPFARLRTWRKSANSSGNGRPQARVRRTPPAALSETDRQAVISAVRAASSESRWKVSRLRSFRNVIVVAALVLATAAVGTVIFAFERPSELPMCFTPANVVCTTSTTPVERADQAGSGGQQSAGSQAATDKIMRHAASGWDVAVVELVGLMAAAIAAAATIRNVRGTSTPYSLPVALAVLKLPTGALTALLGLLLMRGGFVPGLSALDSSAQIVAWALVFGYSQQLLTRLVDDQAQNVLERAGGNTKSLAIAPAVVRSDGRPITAESE